MFNEDAPRPLSRATWYRKYPEDVSKEKWRSCTCGICAEVEDLINTWGMTMSVVHVSCRARSSQARVVRSEMGRRISVRCSDPECRWGMPSSNPLSIALPEEWPSRFKNVITQPTVADALQLELPTMFCGPCGCGCCVKDAEEEARASGIDPREMVSPASTSEL